ncbi:hypothetical protein SFRURICE_013435 [Spodoptera frugiperda]|nr:hypothetical protein SFRURICE_013435 [Spodoptera frugiperda]
MNVRASGRASCTRNICGVGLCRGGLVTQMPRRLPQVTQQRQCGVDHANLHSYARIGRSSESPIDFVVMDTVAGDKSGDTKVLQSTISRFACRIIADRNDVNNCRIYAAGFDSSRNIFLGEKATKWTENHEIDGLTTNGVLIMHPRGDFCGGSATCGPWRETSVGGAVFSLRESRSAQQKSLAPHAIETLVPVGRWPVVLCSKLIQLRPLIRIVRTRQCLHAMRTDDVIRNACNTYDAGLWTLTFQCPVGLNTLVIPRKLSSAHQDLNQPYVYLNCGHVQGEHSWGAEGSESGSRRCPMCLTAGSVVRVCMGIEPAFYVDAGPPTYAFNPCGHMASERTVKYWASVDIPHGTNGFHAICPFCAAPLQGSPGYVRLIFQDNLD